MTAIITQSVSFLFVNWSRQKRQSRCSWHK